MKLPTTGKACVLATLIRNNVFFGDVFHYPVPKNMEGLLTSCRRNPESSVNPTADGSRAWKDPGPILGLSVSQFPGTHPFPSFLFSAFFANREKSRDLGLFCGAARQFYHSSRVRNMKPMDREIRPAPGTFTLSTQVHARNVQQRAYCVFRQPYSSSQQANGWLPCRKRYCTMIVLRHGSHRRRIDDSATARRIDPVLNFTLSPSVTTYLTL